MNPYRAFILAMAAALAVEAGIYYLLAGLGANGQLVVAVEMIWLCVAVVLTLLVVDHFDHSEDERGKSGSRSH
jgi:hypothetical protein